MCGAVKSVARPRPQAVVAIDGQYVELVEEIRPTGKKTVISQRRSKDGLWHGTLAGSAAASRRQCGAKGGSCGEEEAGARGKGVRVDAVFGRPQIGSLQEIAS
jgi:hypothetical protein